MSHASANVAALVLDVHGRPEYHVTGQMKVLPLRK